MATLIVRISDGSRQRLVKLAKVTKKPASFHIEEILGLYLDEYEEACLALERFPGKNAKYYTSKEVKELLEL